MHFQGESERDRRHSVGHLDAKKQLSQEEDKEKGRERERTYSVHVSLARGSVTPEIDSMSEDLPAL